MNTAESQVDLSGQQINPSYDFGKNLNEVMFAIGMTQIDLVHKTGLTPAAVSQILSGQRKPSFNSICVILKVIPVKFERLIQ